jgi:hypothetical protein
MRWGTLTISVRELPARVRCDACDFARDLLDVVEKYGSERDGCDSRNQ